MKKQYLYIAAAVAILYLIKQKKPGQTANDYATEIKYGTPNGWRYFSDGTAISPNGEYYKGGILIYSP
jgi:hypothetical protein